MFLLPRGRAHHENTFMQHLIRPHPQYGRMQLSKPWLRPYFDALVAESGDNLFGDKRDTIFDKMSDKEVNGIIIYALVITAGRETRREIAEHLRDGIARAAVKEAGEDTSDNESESPSEWCSKMVYPACSC